MKISVFRVYSRGKSANSDSQHLFSIVTREEVTPYATPNIADICAWDPFNEERIQQALNLEETRPTSSLDWALVASRNMSMLDVIPTEVAYSSIEEAISNEKSIAAQAWMLRKESEI